MSPEAPSDAAPSAVPAARSPGRRMFTPRAARIPIAADAAQRQGRAATLAWEAFGDGGAARAFLNDHHAELGGRPIDLATASAEGLAIVSAALAERTGGQA